MKKQCVSWKVKLKIDKRLTNFLPIFRILSNCEIGSDHREVCRFTVWFSGAMNFLINNQSTIGCAMRCYAISTIIITLWLGHLFDIGNILQDNDKIHFSYKTIPELDNFRQHMNHFPWRLWESYCFIFNFPLVEFFVYGWRSNGFCKYFRRRKKMNYLHV